MKKYLMVFIVIICIFAVMVSTGFSQEQQKIAQTGMKFLSVSLDARASALSGAVTSLEGTSTSLFYNPAGMANLNNLTHVAFGQVGWIADINYLYGSVAMSIGGGQYGVVGLSFLTVDYGDFKGTIRADNDRGYIDTGIFSPTAMALGIGYAKSLSQKFSVGGQIRLVFQDLQGGITSFDEEGAGISESFNMDVWAFDFGIIYKTGFKSLNFGMNLRNFSREVRYIREQFQLPLTFEIGFSMNMIDFSQIDPEIHSINLSLDAVHPRDYPEQLNLGLEYKFYNAYMLRVGYTLPTDEEGISLGAGVLQNFGDFGLAIDYAYTSFGIFNDVHRFTFQFSLE